MRPRFSLEGKFALACGGLLFAAVITTAALNTVIASAPVAALLALLVYSPFILLIARRWVRSLSKTVQAVGDGVASLRDRDFSMSIMRTTNDEVGALVDSYNALGDVLRRERQSLYQRELLLDTVIQATPLAMVLAAGGRVIFSNVAAREMFSQGRRLEGMAFDDLIQAAPQPFQEAIAQGNDTLFTIERGGEHDVYHLSQRQFLLNQQTHHLYLVRELTREFSRQEVETWKKVIRVIAHELNNSLAPISSLAHSGREVAKLPDAGQLERIFATIEERARHLHTFIDGYARFAKLPQPRPEPVDWNAFLRALQNAAAFRIAGLVPNRPALFDPLQLEQVLINLIKNSREAGAGADSIEVQVGEDDEHWSVEVLDRGSGMSPQVLSRALLPFFSTKPSGAGLGLTVCREVVEAHGGRLAVANRDGGGLAVTLWIPKRAAS